MLLRFVGNLAELFVLAVFTCAIVTEKEYITRGIVLPLYICNSCQKKTSKNYFLDVFFSEELVVCDLLEVSISNTFIDFCISDGYIDFNSNIHYYFVRYFNTL